MTTKARYYFVMLLLLAGIQQANAQATYTPYAFTNFATVAALGIAVDTNGNIYGATAGNNNTIIKITPTGAITTLAGSDGQIGSTNGTGSAARFYQPFGVAVDTNGNVYVADAGNQMIRKITPSGAVTTLAGQAGVSGINDGTGGAAQFNSPYGIAVDRAGNVYVADSGNNTIRKITPAGAVTTLAGQAGVSGTNDGTGSAAQFYSPDGVAVDSAGNVYVGDTLNQTIRKVTPAGAVTTLAGNASITEFGEPQGGYADGIGSTARFFLPSGMAADSGGNIYVADYGNDTIRKITPSGVVTTLAGIAGQSGNADGSGSAAQFRFPFGAAVDSAGNVYVSDGNSTIRKGVTPVGFATNLAISITSPSFSAPINTVNLSVILTGNLVTPTLQWSKESGADQVLFTDPTSSNTTAIFTFAGTYVVSATAFDGSNHYYTSVTITVGLNPNDGFSNPNVANFLASTAPDPVTNANKFLTYGGLFGAAPGTTPNMNDGVTATNYYQAIDPTNIKTSLANWKIANGITTNAIPASTNGALVSAAYFNTGDLGFGRRMVMGGTGAFPAFAVSNFTNVDDAISGSNLIATVAMEYSPGTNGATFTKFYVFDKNGNRTTSAALDGGGPKFIPGLCIVCHGGFNKTNAVPYPNAGNVYAHFLPFDLGSFDYSSSSNFTRSTQEPVFKKLNQGVLDIEQSYAVNDTNRRPAIVELVQGWYGTNSGTNLPSPIQNSFFVPTEWQNSSLSNVLSLPLQSFLYLNLVAQSCRSCHVTRPAAADFSNFSQFDGLKPYIQIDVFGTNGLTNSALIKMPQARRTFERFWNSIAPLPQPVILADYLANALPFFSTPPSVITGVERIGSDLEISFPTTSSGYGGGYRVEQTDTLTGSPVWTPLSGAISGTGGTNQIFEPIIPSIPNRFFHIRSLP